MQFSLGPMYMEKNTRLRTCTSLQNQTNHQQVPSQVLCLPFLPAEPLQPIFKDIRDLLQPSHQEGLHKLLQYIDDNWTQLVIDEKLQRYQRNTYRQYQQQIFQIWDDYHTKKIAVKTQLQRASHFHKPAETTENDSNDDNV